MLTPLRRTCARHTPPRFVYVAILPPGANRGAFLVHAGAKTACFRYNAATFPDREDSTESLVGIGFATGRIACATEWDGAGDRTRTGKPVKAADFRHTASFEADVV
ncbi:hypothetical protein [Burkholderia multivorans]|nr:hypothetical protein [Burkholderia multivorans]MBY4674526.1 hypothetical protein [Burkholderia multivorans]